MFEAVFMRLFGIVQFQVVNVSLDDVMWCCWLLVTLVEYIV